MLKKRKISLILGVILFLTFLMPNTFYSNASFFTPKMEIKENGIHFSNTDNGFKNIGNEEKAINTILTEYRLLIAFGVGVASFVMIGIFIVNFIKLANSKGNPQARSKAVGALIFTGIATAMLGSIVTITKLFYNFL